MTVQQEIEKDKAIRDYAKVMISFNNNYSEIEKELLKLLCDEIHEKNKSNIIKKYKQTEEYTTVLKKKFTDKAKDWHVVCWFSKQQWSEIFLMNQYEDGKLIKNILEAAIKENAREELSLLLEEYDIKLIEHEHPLERQIINSLFDSKLTA